MFVDFLFVVFSLSFKDYHADAIIAALISRVKRCNGRVPASLIQPSPQLEEKVTIFLSKRYVRYNLDDGVSLPRRHSHFDGALNMEGAATPKMQLWSPIEWCPVNAWDAWGLS